MEWIKGHLVQLQLPYQCKETQGESQWRREVQGSFTPTGQVGKKLQPIKDSKICNINMSPSASFWKLLLQTPNASWKWNEHKWLHDRWYGVNLLSDNNGLTMDEYKTGWTMIFIMSVKVEQWYLQDVNFKFTPTHICFNYSPESMCSHVMIPLILLINVTFCGIWGCPGWRKFYHKGSTPASLLSWSFSHGHK